MFYLIPYLNKKPNNIIIHIRINDRPYSNENVIYVEIKKITELIKTHHLNCKNIFISSPILRLDNKKAANVLKSDINILKREENNISLHDNTDESHLDLNGLHLIVKGTIELAENFISSIWRFWYNGDSNRDLKQNDNNILLTSTFEHLITKNLNLRLISSNNDFKESVRSILKSLPSNHPQIIIIRQININYIRYKFYALKLMLAEVLDILMISETKLDDSFPEAQFYIGGFGTPFT